MGFLTKDNDLKAYSCQGSINSDIAIAFIDHFVESINEPAVIVMNNAPIHHREIFSDKIQEWKQKGIGVFFLPRYSPQLNPIEMLWKKIKYEWLSINAYESWDKLVDNIEDIIRNVGSKFTINFA